MKKQANCTGLKSMLRHTSSFHWEPQSKAFFSVKFQEFLIFGIFCSYCFYWFRLLTLQSLTPLWTLHGLKRKGLFMCDLKVKLHRSLTGQMHFFAEIKMSTTQEASMRCAAFSKAVSWHKALTDATPPAAKKNHYSCLFLFVWLTYWKLNRLLPVLLTWVLMKLYHYQTNKVINMWTSVSGFLPIEGDLVWGFRY